MTLCSRLRPRPPWPPCIDGPPSLAAAATGTSRRRYAYVPADVAPTPYHRLSATATPMSNEGDGALQAEAGPSSASSAKAASSPGTRTASPGPAQTTAAEAQNRQHLRRPASHGRLSKLMLPGRSRAASLAHDASPVTALAGDSAVASGRTTPEQRRRTARGASPDLF